MCSKYYTVGRRAHLSCPHTEAVLSVGIGGNRLGGEFHVLRLLHFPRICRSSRGRLCQDSLSQAEVVLIPLRRSSRRMSGLVLRVDGHHPRLHIHEHTRRAKAFSLGTSVGKKKHSRKHTGQMHESSPFLPFTLF